MKNIMVIGGGIAGLCCAGALSKAQFSPVIFEKGDYTQSYKAGEHFSSAGKFIFEELEIPHQLLKRTSWECTSIISKWGNDIQDRDLFFNPYGPDVLLDRPLFEKEFSDILRHRGIPIHLNSRIHKVERSNGRWKVKIASETMFFDFIIDASGRNSLMSKVLNLSTRILDDLISISFVSHMGPIPHLPINSLIIESTSTGWFYCVNSSFKTIFTFFTDADLYLRHNKTELIIEELKSSQLLKHLPIKSIHPQNIHVNRCNSIINTTFCGDDWAFVGDSAMAFDPLAGQGIFKAMYTSSKLVRYLVQGFLPKYELDLNALSETYLKQYKIHYKEGHGAQDGIFWQRRHNDAQPLLRI